MILAIILCLILEISTYLFSATTHLHQDIALVQDIFVVVMTFFFVAICISLPYVPKIWLIAFAVLESLIFFSYPLLVSDSYFLLVTHFVVAIIVIPMVFTWIHISRFKNGWVTIFIIFAIGTTYILGSLWRGDLWAAYAFGVLMIRQEIVSMLIMLIITFVNKYKKFC